MADGYERYKGDAPTLSGFDRAVFEDVSREEPWRLVERFSELDRHSGTADERAAASYVTDRLAAFGVPFDRHDPPLPITRAVGATIESPDGSVVRYGDGERPSVKPELYSRDGTVTAPVTVVETADPVAPVDPSEIERPVEGRVVVVETRSVSVDLALELDRRGAAAVVGIHPRPDEPFWGRVSSPAWGGVPTRDRRRAGDVDADGRLGLVAVAVSRSVGETLLAAVEDADAPEVTVSATVETEWVPCPVVVARVESPESDDDIVLCHAHLDSWHGGVTDNATGDGAVLELARVFGARADELERDLWLAWWPGHSQGSYAGSAWFAEEYALELHERCVAHVNVDSPGAADATEFGDYTMWMPEGAELCRGAIADVAGAEATGRRPLRAGDYSFSNVGVTGLHLVSSNIPRAVREKRGYVPAGSGGNSDAYHLTTDTLDKADPEVLVRDTRVYAVTLARLLTADVVPLDYRETVARQQETLAEYDTAAGSQFDLAPVREQLDALADELSTFYDAVEDGQVAASVANETQKRLSRRLVALDFTSAGRFDQDPTTERPPYPALEPATSLPDCDEAERHRRRTHLRRARNRAVYELRAARGALPDGLTES